MSYEIKNLLEVIEAFCNEHKMAISTFGRLSVNDGKLVSRLRNGNDVTLKTSKKIRQFISNKSQSEIKKISSENTEVVKKNSNTENSESDKTKRFYDNRQNYLSFINTTNEKWQIAQRAAKELKYLKPTPPALKLFDAGMGGRYYFISSS